MQHLIRSASLTNFSEIGRRAGMDPEWPLVAFGLRQPSLSLELEVPTFALRALLQTIEALPRYDSRNLTR